MSYWTSMLGGQVRYVDVRGIRTRILEAGDEAAQTTILLHGSGGHAENFVTNVVPLSAAGHTVAPDLLGHGWNDRPPGVTYSFRALIDHVEDLMETLDHRQVNLVGMSLGGLIGARVAAERPDKVKRLVMVCPPALHPNGSEGFSRNTASSRKLFENPSRELVHERFVHMLHRPEVLSEEMVEARVAMCRLPGAADAIIAILDDFAENWQQFHIDADLLSKITCPTLLAWGRYNPVGPEVAEQAAAKLKDAEVVVFEDSGHWPHVEDQALFQEKVVEFLSS